LAIGIAFNISAKIALIVSIAVIAHKIGDGIGLVSMMLHHKNSEKRSWKFLIVDALVPVAGILLANVLKIPEIFLGYTLAFFAGFFIYIGASDLLPEAHRANASIIVMLATVAGFALVFILNFFIAI
jgi:ZIP family zinc transporter